MSVKRSSDDQTVLELDASTLTNLVSDDDDGGGRHRLDLDHPVIRRIVGSEEIGAIEFDASVTRELATRFDSFSLVGHRVENVEPRETLEFFVNVESLSVSGISERVVDEWPEWIFDLRGLKVVVVDDERRERLDVGGLELMEWIEGSVGRVEERANEVEDDASSSASQAHPRSTQKINVQDFEEDAAAADGDASSSTSQARQMINVQDPQEDAAAGVEDAAAAVENAASAVENAPSSSVEEAPIDLSLYRFRLTKFKLLSILRHKKRILDLSARPENPFTRGKLVKELIICDDVDAATASLVLNFDFAFSRLSSISPLPQLRLFCEVLEVNLLDTGMRVKPYWTHEMAKLQGILFNISEWQRVDIGGIEATADGGFRFLMTSRIAEVMMTRLKGCLNFDDALWHREKRIDDVILEDDFSQRVKDEVKEIVFLGLALKEIPAWTKTFPNLEWILMSDWKWHRLGTPFTDVILGEPNEDGLCFNVTPQVIHDMAQYSDGFGGYIDLRENRLNRWTQGRRFSRLRVSITPADNDDQVVTNIGLLKLSLNSLRQFEGNFRFLNQIEEIWFEDDGGNGTDGSGSVIDGSGGVGIGGSSEEGSGTDHEGGIGGRYGNQLRGIPDWVKDMENLQWIRIGSDNWVFLLNQWILEEMLQESKNISLNQNSGAEWTQGKRISKIMFMSDVDPATGDDVGSVNLNKNALNEFPVDLFAYFSGLRRFYAMYNRLSQLPPHPPPRLSSDLDEIDLSHNFIRSIPSWLFKLPSLRTLSFSHNAISGLHSISMEEEEEEENGARKQRRIEDDDEGPRRRGRDDDDEEARNFSSGFPPRPSSPSLPLLDGLTINQNDCLDKLSLSHNRLTHLPPWIFTHLKKLRKLDVSFNQLESLPRFGERGKDENEEEEQQQQRRQRSERPPFLVSDSLEELNFHSNHLPGVPLWLFSAANLPKLRKVNLCENRLSTLPAGLLSAMTEGRLTEVQVFGNEIAAIDLTELKAFLMAEEERAGKGTGGGGEGLEEAGGDAGGEGKKPADWEEEEGEKREEGGGGGGEVVDRKEGSRKNRKKGRKKERKKEGSTQGKGLKAFNRIRFEPDRLITPPHHVWMEGREAVLRFIDRS